MPIYAIGDVQGCADDLRCLLDKLNFTPSRDELWFAGDLVNRGPESLEALRLVKSLNARVVLGNHDLHLLACYYSDHHELKQKDTLREIFTAEDRDDLMSWLIRQPLLFADEQRDVVMTHAGLPHIWSVSEARGYSREVEAVLQGPDRIPFFDHMYGNSPSLWNEALKGTERWRAITNYLTRMRFIKESGELDFKAKESLDSAPEGFQPWFKLPRRESTRIYFGHWAAIQGNTDSGQMIALDTGCVWGGELTAVNVDTGERIACDCQRHRPIK